MNYKKYDYDSFQVFTMQIDKFKNCYMEINFRDDIREISSAKRNFLTYLLSYTSLTYPTKREMIIESEELYNLNGTSGTYRNGYNLSSYFGVDFIHPKYIKEKDYLDQVFAFTFDLLMNPNVKDNLWDERSFEIIRERLHVEVDQYKEKPMALAKVESKKKLFSDNVIGQRIIGTHEEIDAITREDLYAEYHQMFQNSCCEILLIGDLDMDEVVKKIANYFHKSAIVKKDISWIIETPRKQFQEMNVMSNFKQTQLIQYYQFPALSYKERNFVFPLFSAILGIGNLSDKLGKYLRMENSLCYAYNFQYSVTDLFGVITTQLKKENVPKALEFIAKAFDEMEKGIITEDELLIQQQKFLSDLLLREDSIYGLIDNYYFHEIYDGALYEEYNEEIMKVTIADIKSLAKKMKLTFRYILEEEEIIHEGN